MRPQVRLSRRPIQVRVLTISPRPVKRCFISEVEHFLLFFIARNRRVLARLPSEAKPIVLEMQLFFLVQGKFVHEALGLVQDAVTC
jgi:hypothetical protein